jgi:hypothetical protein
VAVLLGIDVVSSHDVTSKLLSSTGGLYATVALSGQAMGAIEGAATELNLRGLYRVDLARGLVSELELELQEKREIGHVGPGLDVRCQIKVEVKNCEPPAELKTTAPQLASSAGDESQPLRYAPEHGGFSFLHGRSWHISEESPQVVVMRLVERGDLIAQCNISPLPPLASTERPTLEQFVAEVRKALGKNFGQLAGQPATAQQAPDRATHQVIVNGEVSGVPIQWRYYLVNDDQGRRVALVFTLERSLHERFGAADRQIVESLSFAAPSATSPGQPTPAAPK